MKILRWFILVLALIVAAVLYFGWFILLGFAVTAAAATVLGGVTCRKPS